MNGFFLGFMLSEIVLLLWRIFKKIWWLPVSLFLGDRIGTAVGEALNMTDAHIVIFTWVFAGLFYTILKFKIVDRIRSAS